MRARRRPRRGFALYAALAVVLLFSFVATLIYMVIREGDRRIERYKGDRAALNLAESAVAVLERRFMAKQGPTDLPPAQLTGGTASGKMTSTGTNQYRIVAVGDAPIPGSESAHVVLVVDGSGNATTGDWNRTLWRYARSDER